VVLIGAAQKHCDVSISSYFDDNWDYDDDDVVFNFSGSL
jgi:hypothetical protein